MTTATIATKTRPRRRKKAARGIKTHRHPTRTPVKVPQKFVVVDLFCGAGGTSTGATHAIEELGAEIDLAAINHWDKAVATHSLNHPKARHYIQDLDGADPEAIVPEGYVDLLLASPECRHFSRARGGKPMKEQGRMNPWLIQRWLTALDVRCVLVENVPEFTSWGPLNADRRPDKSRKGLYFEEWVRSLWGLGYTVEWRILNAADYGDATSRVRFFLQARKDGQPIRWPEPTHSKNGGDMLGELPKWRGAREIIDWSNLGRSLLDDPKYKRRPLSVNTRRRIARGLHRFGGPLASQYIRLLDLDDESIAAISEEKVDPVSDVRGFHGSNRQHTAPRDMEEPIATVTTWGNGGAYMVQPIVEPLVGANRNNNVPKPLEHPVPTITTGGGGGCYVVQPSVEPFVLGQQSGATPRPTTEPIPTIAAAGAISMVRPMIVEYYGNGGSRCVSEPLSTATTKARHALAQPTAVPLDSDESRAIMMNPQDHAYLIPNFGERGNQQPRIHDIDSPTPAVTSRGAGSLLTPTASEVTTEDAEEMDPRRLVVIDGRMYILDIRYRMLQNPELARAMGFTDEEQEYEFVGNISEITKQIGNAVPVNLAAALVKSVLGPAPETPSEDLERAVA